MSDYYTESQMQRIEQAAYDGAMLEAGKEWERQRYEFGETEANLAERVTELEAEVTKCHELQDSYCDRIAELEKENDRLQDGWFRDETICPDGSLRPKVSDLLNRIAELSQAVGLITTMKPTMVMDANHPLDMVREVGEHVTARIASLELQLSEARARLAWIPVGERLPEEFTPVLTLSKDNDKPVTAILDAGFWWSNVDWALNVTHWMPLPELPEVK